ncbi:hypothetical protein ACFV3E_40875 [Streptomyces sp. NPDC059718]
MPLTDHRPAYQLPTLRLDHEPLVRGGTYGSWILHGPAGCVVQRYGPAGPVLTIHADHPIPGAAPAGSCFRLRTKCWELTSWHHNLTAHHHIGIDDVTDHVRLHRTLRGIYRRYVHVPQRHTGRPKFRHTSYGRVLVLCPAGHLVASVSANDWPGSLWEARRGDPAYTVTCDGTVTPTTDGQSRR